MSAETHSPEGIHLEYEDETELWVAVGEESGIAGQGENPVTAVENLQDAIAGHNGEGEPVTEQELRDAGINPEDNNSDDELPEFMR